MRLASRRAAEPLNYIPYSFLVPCFLLSGETEQNVSLLCDFNDMLLGVFVVVIEAQKLEVMPSHGSKA